MKKLKYGEYYVLKTDENGYVYLDTEFDYFYYSLSKLVNK